MPEYDDRALFEKLILDGAQAGLSWLTILKKRDAYRAAFDAFDPAKIACYGPDRIEALMQNPGIVRNRLKIESAVKNACAYRELVDTLGSFSEFLWQFTGNATRHNTWRCVEDLPVSTPESDAMSKALKARGFSFVGSTICYAFMQAVGMVNDHVTTCFRYAELKG